MNERSNRPARSRGRMRGGWWHWFRHPSLAAGLNLVLLPVVVAGVCVVVVTRSSLDNNAVELTRAHRVKDLAVSAFNLLLVQDDATKDAVV